MNGTAKGPTSPVTGRRGRPRIEPTPDRYRGGYGDYGPLWPRWGRPAAAGIALMVAGAATVRVGRNLRHVYRMLRAIGVLT